MLWGLGLGGSSEPFRVDGIWGVTVVRVLALRGGRLGVLGRGAMLGNSRADGVQGLYKVYGF